MADKPIMVAVAKIRPNPWNPNKMSAEAFAQLVENARRFGFNGTVLLRKLDETEGDIEYEIADGEHRWRVAKELGMATIPSFVRDLTDAEAKSQTLAMNRLHGEMDPAQMAQLVREIDEAGINREEFLTFSGFNSDELDAYEQLASASEPLPDPKPAGDQSGDVNDGYFLVVTCKGEADQLALVEKLEKDGYDCRVVVS